jgi:hypothetical protein
MTLKDTKENTEFKYFFINKFEWVNPMDHGHNAGHPKEKKVYRGWHNKDTNSYRLAPSLNQAFWLESLVDSTGRTGYKSDIVLVSKENILDLNLSEEDLDNLIIWIETDNKDLKDVVFGSYHQAPPAIIAMIKSGLPNEEDDTFQGFVESSEELKALDPMAFDIVWGFIDHLLLQMHEIPEGSVDADWLSKGPEGAAINISESLKCLNRYIGDNRRINRDAEDLYKAMSHITNEIMRAELNG